MALWLFPFSPLPSLSLTHSNTTVCKTNHVLDTWVWEGPLLWVRALTHHLNKQRSLNPFRVLQRSWTAIAKCVRYIKLLHWTEKLEPITPVQNFHIWFKKKEKLVKISWSRKLQLLTMKSFLLLAHCFPMRP